MRRGAIAALLAIGACAPSDDERVGSGDAASDDSSSEAASGGGAGADAGGAGGASGDASVDAAADCSELSEADCVKRMQKFECSAYFGSKVPGGAPQFVACDSFCVGGAAISCSVDPGGQCWRFPDTCSPSGWTYVELCNLGAPPSTGCRAPSAPRHARGASASSSRAARRARPFRRSPGRARRAAARHDRQSPHQPRPLPVHRAPLQSTFGKPTNA